MNKGKEFVCPEPGVLEQLDDRTRLWRALGTVLLIIIWAISIYFLFSLPETIPTKFSGSGAVLNRGSKWTLLILPVFATAFSFIFPLAKRFPKMMNTPVKLTEENREIQIKLVLSFLAFVSVALELMFGLLLFQMAYAALGHTVDSVFMLIVFIPMGLLIVSLGIYLKQSVKYK